MNSTQKSKFFADTYALVALLLGKEEYRAYTDAHLVVTKLNIAEFYYTLLREQFQQPHSIIEKYQEHIIPTSWSALIEGMKFKYHYRKRKLSYADCLGYATALELNIPFLTGDKQFKDLPNVEFVR